LGLGLVVERGVGGVKIVFNRAEMTIYSVYCSRNLGCLCGAGKGADATLSQSPRGLIVMLLLNQ